MSHIATQDDKCEWAVYTNSVWPLRSPTFLCFINIKFRYAFTCQQPVRWSQRASPARRWPSWGSSGSWATCIRRHPRPVWRQSSWRHRPGPTRGTHRGGPGTLWLHHPHQQHHHSLQFLERILRFYIIHPTRTYTGRDLKRRQLITIPVPALPLGLCHLRQRRIHHLCLLQHPHHHPER